MNGQSKFSIQAGICHPNPQSIPMQPTKEHGTWTTTETQLRSAIGFSSLEIATRHPRYGCRSCESAIVQAPAPARIVEGSLPTEALIAQVLVAKYADHLPLYRQAQIYARQGIQLDRSALADWVGRAAWYLTWFRHISERRD
jgi:transposase